MSDNTKKCKKCGESFEGDGDTCATCFNWYTPRNLMSSEELRQLEKKGGDIKSGIMHGIPPWDAGRV